MNRLNMIISNKTITKEDIIRLDNEFADKTPAELLEYFLSADSAINIPKDRIALASSLGAEDQVLTDMILKIYPAARIFVLDTGRFPQETYEVISSTMKKYKMRYEFYFPEASGVESMEGKFGPNLFYDSQESRKLCCEVRKVKPLQRVLKTLDAWITGLRRGQSITRGSVSKVEWDEANSLVKLSPLADWTNDMVWNYIKKNNVPYNSLHDAGYPSIGCAPCTRAVQPGEDLRAGRWWWESPEKRECGLHYRDCEPVRRDEK